ncbi:MAG TPA: ABC transporter substrate-binding protein [Chloroflexota bacterium]|nr:ABC transporter substrate-binding protein [Chloroflexota bacterium]
MDMLALRLTTITLLIGSLLSMSACTTSGTPSSNSAVSGAMASTENPSSDVATADTVPINTPIRMQTLQNTADIALFIAKRLGYFEEQGLVVDWERVRSAADTIPLLSTGTLDVAAGGSSPGLFNAIQRGVNIRIVTDKTRNAPGSYGSSFAVRQDLLDSGAVRSVADLKGRTISSTTLRSTTGAYLYAALTPFGLGLSDVEVVELPAADTLAALANRKIDAAFVFEPFQTLVQQQGLATPIVWISDVYPNSVTNFLMYSSQFATERPEAARRFMIAHLKGTRYFWDAYLKGRDRDAVLNILVDYRLAPSLEVARQMHLSPGDPDGQIRPEDFAADQQIFVTLGWLDHVVDLEGVIDQRFARQAVEALGGPYPRE